jgi:hypothetical protein
MPLTRSRRRWLIATLVLVGILGAWWVLLPRIDERFVGTWVIERVRSGDLIIWSARKTYNRDGTMTTILAGDPGPEESRWQVDGNTLEEYDPGSHFPVALVNLYQRLTGQIVRRSQSRYEIISVSEHEITLGGIGSPGADQIIWRRALD